MDTSDEHLTAVDLFLRDLNGMDSKGLYLRVMILISHASENAWTLPQATALIASEGHGAEPLARKVVSACPLLGHLLVEATTQAGRELDESQMPSWIELLLSPFGQGKAFGLGGLILHSHEDVAKITERMIEASCHWPERLDAQRQALVRGLAQRFSSYGKTILEVIAKSDRRAVAIRAEAAAP
jgi:hypothetical protein